jgi:phosphatidylglycerol:prolipoprotein diacylglycerol transferase
MRQVLFEVPGLGLKVFGFSAMLLLGLLGALQLAAWRARREEVDPEVVYELAFWMVPGGVIGARLFYVAQYPQTVHGVLDLFKLRQGGIVLYGSIIGGVAGSFLYWLLRRFPWRPMMDVVAPSLILAIAFGRLGCFLNGCCYGDACTLPWAVRFPAGTLPWLNHVAHGLIPSTMPRSLPVHPTQLYSFVDGLILLGLLTAYYPLRRRDGEVMALLAVTYPITRFLIEWLRNDEGVFVAGMTISQTISVGLLLGGLLLWAYLRRQPAGLYADRLREGEALAEPLESERLGGSLALPKK